MNLFRRVKDLLRGRATTGKRSRPLWRGLHLESLETRLAPAAYNFDANANTLAINLTTINESVTVTQVGTDFLFTLSGGTTFNQAGTSTASGDGTATITIPDADLATSLRIQNSAATGSNNATFNGPGSLFSQTIAVDLTRDGTSNFINLVNGFDLSTLSSLSLTTTRSIFIGSDSDVQAIGALTLAANQQATPTTGNFIGIENFGNLLATGADAITLSGRGGDDSDGNQVGVRNAGNVTAAGTNNLVIIDGTGGTGAQSDGVRNAGAVTSSGSGSVLITGTGLGGADAEGFANEAGASVVSFGNVGITADSIFLDSSSTPSSINAGANAVTISPLTTGRDVDLGTDDTAASLGLTDGELNTITAGTLSIGNASTGTITVNSVVSPMNVSTLSLRTNDNESVVFDSTGAIGDGPSTVTITTGSVTSPGSATSDVTASELTAVATNGSIGTENAPLTTSVGNLEATATSGIVIANTGVDLRIGGINPLLAGVTVDGTVGGILLSNDHSIFIDLNIEFVAAPNDVVITATGLTSDVVTGGNNATSMTTFGAIESTSGAVVITAGHDLFIGDVSTGFGDVRGTGVALSAGRHVEIDAQSDVISNGAGNVMLTAGTAGGEGDVSISKNIGNGASIFTSGGSITITAAPDALVRLDSDATLAGGPLTLDTTQGGATGGDVTINADRFELTADDRIQAGTTGIVTIQQVSADWDVDLGASTDDTPNTLEISNNEVDDRVIAAVLRIGDPNNTGDVFVTGGITPNQTNTLSVRTAGAIFDQQDGTDLTVTNLALTAGQGIDDGAGGDFDIQVTNLAATNTTGFGVVLSNTGSVNVTTVDGVVGLRNQAADQGLQLDTTTGDITVMDTVAVVDVLAAGSGVINLLAAGDLLVNDSAVVRSDSGAVALISNFDNDGANEDVMLGAGASVQTTGDVQLNADPNVDGTGGALVFGTGANVQDGANGPVLNLTLVSAANLTLTSFAATNTFSARSTGGDVLDDGDDGTVVTATNVTLTAAGRIGGSDTIDPDEVIQQSGDFAGAIDVDVQDGMLTVVQTGIGGNVQLRETSGGLAISSLDLSSSLLNNGNQLALISSGGNFNVDVSLTLTGGLDVDLLLATTDDNGISIASGAVVNNGGATATTNLVVSAGTEASINGPPAVDGTAEIVGVNVGLYTTGGNVGGDTALQIDAVRLDGFTNGNLTTGGNANLTDTSNGISIGFFNAGAGDVFLGVLNNATGNSSIVSVTPNDGTPEIIGDSVTLDALDVEATGDVGQIGFTSGGTDMYFEVDSNVLRATTNDSRLWISEVGSSEGTAGTQIDLIGAGSSDVFLRATNGGAITSASPNGVADVLADNVDLTSPQGSFGGASDQPLEIAATTLTADVSSGDLFVEDRVMGLILGNVEAEGVVNVSAPDTASPDDVLSVMAGAMVIGNSEIILSGGDGIVLPADAILDATTVTLNVGPGDSPDGSESSLLGTIVGTSAMVQGGDGLDSVTVGLVASPEIDVSTAAGADTLFLRDGATLFGGTFNGGAGVDTIDYNFYTTPVAVNLGLGTMGLTAALGGDQVVTPMLTTAAGTATFDNYDVEDKDFAVTVTVTGLAPADVTGLTLNRAPFGVNGPVIIDLLALGTLVPAGDGFTLTLTGVDLDPLDEAAFLGGITYVSVSISAGELIRGQVFSTGNVDNEGAGTATGTGTIRNLENVIGGDGNDSLIGNFSVNNLEGRLGDDVILGGPAADTMVGGESDDVLVWSNGDGSDVMEGRADDDRVQVNGSLTSNEVFTVNAAGGGIDFDRTSPGPFSLDIDTTEALTVIGNAGTDSFTVGDLTGVEDLMTINLAGLADADTFVVTPAASIAIDVTGGNPTPPASPGDVLTLDLTGVTGATLTATPDASGFAGDWAFDNRADVTFNQLEAVAPAALISGTAFADTDRDGVQDAGELGLADVTVALDRGADGTPDATTMTDADGNYSFLIEAGTTVRVRAVAPDGQVQTSDDPADFATVDGPVEDVDFGFAPPGGGGGGAGDTVTVSTGNGQASNVTLADGTSTMLTPFAGFLGEVLTARGDVTGDGVTDFVFGAGASSTGGHVKVFDGATGAEVRSFFAFQGFNGGATVGTGDVTGDGVDDLIVGAGVGGIGGHVKVFDGATGAEVRSFFAFDGFPGEVRVAGGDVNGDGFSDIIVGAGPGSVGGHVKVFDGATGAVLRSFFAFDGFPGGVFVGSGDLDGDGTDEILVGADAGAGPHVKAFGASDQAILSFFAFDQGFQGGVRVAGMDRDGDGDDEIVVGSGSGAQGHVVVFDADLTLLDSLFVTDPAVTAGIFVA